MTLAIGREEVELDPDDPGEKGVFLGATVFDDRLSIDADAAGLARPLFATEADAHVDVGVSVVVDGGADEGVDSAGVRPGEALDTMLADRRELRVSLAISPDGLQKLRRRNDRHRSNPLSLAFKNPSDRAAVSVECPKRAERRGI